MAKEGSQSLAAARHRKPRKDLVFCRNGLAKAALPTVAVSKASDCRLGV